MMMDIAKKIQNLGLNISVLSPFMGGRVHALSSLLRTYHRPQSVMTGHYGGQGFSFRRCDLPAVKEVLHFGEYTFLKDVIERTKNPLIYDIGAHIGLFALWALSVNPGADIHSVEPSPGTYHILQSNAARARTRGAAWSAENFAAWNKDDVIGFSNESGSTMSHKASESGQVKIKTLTLSAILQQIGPDRSVDIMKIDIEGAEDKFLGDATGEQLSRIRNIAIELHPNYADTDKVLRLLKQHYPDVRNIKENTNSKPLLFCGHHG